MPPSTPTAAPLPEATRLHRWRMVLGEAAAQPLQAAPLSVQDAAIDAALAALYDRDSAHSLRQRSSGNNLFPVIAAII